jgi:DNA-binding MarR family transcriptional regulator
MIIRLTKKKENNKKKPDERKSSQKHSPRHLPPLTEKQAKCLTFIAGYFSEHGIYPTQREIIDAMGFTSTTAEMYLEPLRRKGYLQRKARGRSRNIRTTPMAREVIENDSIEIFERRKAAR